MYILHLISIDLVNYCCNLKNGVLFLLLKAVACFLHLEQLQHTDTSERSQETQPQIRVGGNESKLFFSTF